MDWIETGVKLSGKAPERRGFGTELLERTLAYELGGEANLRFEPGGLHCTIALPLDDGIVLSLDKPAKAAPRLLSPSPSDQ